MWLAAEIPKILTKKIYSEGNNYDFNLLLLTGMFQIFLIFDWEKMAETLCRFTKNHCVDLRISSCWTENPFFLLFKESESIEKMDFEHSSHLKENHTFFRENSQEMLENWEKAIEKDEKKILYRILVKNWRFNVKIGNTKTFSPVLQLFFNRELKKTTKCWSKDGEWYFVCCLWIWN